MPWRAFWRSHLQFVNSTAQMVEHQEIVLSREQSQKSPFKYMVKKTVFIACALTIAGASWYIAVDLTTPSDLTAIYNASAFFAYAFSVPLLKEQLRMDKAFSVMVAILGVLVIAYGDSFFGDKTPDNGNSEAKARTLGNVIIGIGSVLYGLYEVLYKRYACPPSATSPGRSMVFANVFGSSIGFFTLSVLWIPLPILHYTGIEPFVLPRGQTANLLAISTLSNAVFSGSFLVLMSLTSPVLSSVAALLTIFLVAVVDWMITGIPLSLAAFLGGGLICIAFGLLSWSTWREMKEEQEKV
jgi:drug/metabolite transporter (DMT)-like permease